MVLDFGNGVRSPFDFLYQNDSPLSRVDSVYSGRSSWTCKAFLARIADQDVVVASLPHLSRYNVVGKMQVAEWIAGYLSNT
jgi:hypothetical protein